MERLGIDPARRRQVSVRTEKYAAEGGFAFPIVLFALVVLTVFGAASLQRTNDELLSGQAMSRSVLALYAAEAGLSTAMSGWDQTAVDTLMPLPGDSLVGSWTSLANSCTYRTVTRRIDGAETSDKLYAVVSTGRAPEGSLGQRELGLIVKVASGGAGIGDAMSFGGSFAFVDSPVIDGDCAGLHVNGDIDSDGLITADDISVTGTASGSSYSPTPTEGADSVAIPTLNYSDFCDTDADYILNAGSLFDVALSSTSSSSSYGWNYSGGRYQSQEDPEPPAGTYCFDGNVDISTNLGGSGKAISIFTTKSIRVPGNPTMEPAHPDGYLLFAEGDVQFEGNPTFGAADNEGLIYAGAQCRNSDNPRLYGAIMCADGPDPPGAENWASTMESTGNIRLTYSCRFASAGGGVPVPLSGGRSWWQVW